MKIPLSKRLSVCASFVTPGQRVADIGCDHGYLGIYLLHNRIADSVIASDVNRMPLQSAVRNAEKFGVAAQMTFCLSDGAQSIPRDFDAMICAGMGADTIVSVLENAPWLRDRQYHLILQCQSKTPMLRRFLSDNGWHITKERIVRDGRFLYTVMLVLWDPEQGQLSPGQWYFPPVLLDNPAPELAEYFKRLLRQMHLSVDNRHDQADAHMCDALQELENDTNLSWLKEEQI